MSAMFKPQPTTQRVIVVNPAPRPRLPPVVDAATRKREPKPPLDGCFDPAGRETVSISELRTGVCRWPFGSLGSYRFCGSATIDPSDPECVYCVGHAALAYVPMPKKRTLVQQEASHAA